MLTGVSQICKIGLESVPGVPVTPGFPIGIVTGGRLREDGEVIPIRGVEAYAPSSFQYGKTDNGGDLDLLLQGSDILSASFSRDSAGLLSSYTIDAGALYSGVLLPRRYAGSKISRAEIRLSARELATIAVSFLSLYTQPGELAYHVPEGYPLWAPFMQTVTIGGILLEDLLSFSIEVNNNLKPAYYVSYEGARGAGAILEGAQEITARVETHSPIPAVLRDLIIDHDPAGLTIEVVLGDYIFGSAGYLTLLGCYQPHTGESLSPGSNLVPFTGDFIVRELLWS